MFAGVMAFTLGAGAWSFSEYALHRWVGHGPRKDVEFAREHLTHHAQRLYFTPTWKKFTMALPVIGTMAVVAGALAGATGVAGVAGYAVAYAGYEWLHRRLHTHAPRGPVGRSLRRHHFAHHFNGPQTNHGVTSPVWDLVFKTWRDPGVIRVPEKHAMPWLIDEATGEVFEAYAGDYRVHRAKRERAAA